MKQDQVIRTTFSVIDDDGNNVTGRAGIVTTSLQMDNAATGETVTVAESSAVLGDYEASFTPLTTGTYRLNVYDAVYNPQGWTGTWEVPGADDDSLAADLVTVQADLDNPDQYKATGFAVPNEYDVELAAIQGDIDFLQHIEGGRWRIIDNKMYFYEANNTTVVAIFDLLDSGGSPTMTDVMERVRSGP